MAPLMAKARTLLLTTACVLVPRYASVSPAVAVLCRLLTLKKKKTPKNVLSKIS